MVLTENGFDKKWIRWIMECISSVSYNLIVNGKKSNLIIPTRGIRQGDLLSLYLFLFIVNVLSRMINKALKSKCLSSIKLSRGCLVLSHLLFVDDALFFLLADKKNCDVLRKYCDG